MGLFFRTLIITVFLTACSSSPPVVRAPSSESKAGGAERIGKMYQYKGWLAVPPLRFVAKAVVKKKVIQYVETLPLEKEIQARITSHVRSDAFSDQLIPFVLALRELYAVPRDYKTVSFEKYIREAFPAPASAPGLEHDLFSYKVAEGKKDGAGAGTRQIVAVALSFFDAIILQNRDFRLGSAPELTPELRIRVRALVLKYLDFFLEQQPDGSAAADVVEAIRKDPEQVDGIVETAIDFFYQYSMTLSRMFAQRQATKEALRAWMERQLEEPRQGELWNYVSSAAEPKPYAVHLIVDGLQGNLVQALLAPDKSPFLKVVKQENDEYGKFKPSFSGAVLNAKKKLNTRFLDHLVTGDGTYSHPAYLPNMRRHFSAQAPGLIPSGASTTPTTSGRNLPMVASGAPVSGPHGTGIPNFSFVDREKENAFYFLGNQSLLLNRFTGQSGMRSLFERLPDLFGINCSSVYVRGADLTYDGYLTVTQGAKSRGFGDRICVGELHRRAKNQVEFDRLLRQLLSLKGSLEGARGDDSGHLQLARSLMDRIAELSNEVLPQYLLYYYPWPDHYSHYTGPFSDEIISPTGELNRLDFWLGQVTEAYKKGGVLDQTLFAMAGDHGLSPVFWGVDPKEIFTRMQEEGIRLKLRQISAENNLPRIVDFNNRPNVRGYDVIIGATAGGSFVIDLFLDQKDRWKVQPTYTDLLKHRFASGDEVNMIEKLLSELSDSLQYLVVRDGASNVAETRTRLLTMRDGTRVDAKIRRIKDRVYYASERDLLGVRSLSRYLAPPEDLSEFHGLIERCVDRATEADPETWCDERQWRTLTSFTDTPDSVVQLAHLYDTDRAGTINLFPAKLVGYHTKKIGKHAGEDFHEKDAFVAFWGTPVKGKKPLRSELNGSLAPTLYEYLSGQQIPENDPSWYFRSLARDLGIR